MQCQKIGCGLGGLDWNNVFREICKFHSQLDENISNDLTYRNFTCKF